MTATKKSHESKLPKFENRVRFNWGFHQATLAVEQGWAIPENNFGFANHGPMSNLGMASDVVRRHFDKTYAEGWMAGYVAMKTDDTKRPASSEEAWGEAMADGRVSE